VSTNLQRFSVLALLYLVTNARIGSGANRRRVQRVMTRPEREAITAILERLPDTVAAWSDGLAALEPMHLVEVRRPLLTLSSVGDGKWWAGPRDTREELVELTADRPYDSVIVLWPSAPDVPLCGWGCSIGPSDATFGAGFSSIESGHWPTLATDPDPAQGYVHEWLHQVEAIYRGLGLGEDELPNLHAAGAFTSTRPVTEPPFGGSFADYHDGFTGADGVRHDPARTWSPWYRDWMTGRLRPLDTLTPDGPAGEEPAGDRPAVPAETSDAPAAVPLGLTPERWARRAA
jgi:hypothetical protein